MTIQQQEQQKKNEHQNRTVPVVVSDGDIRNDDIDDDVDATCTTTTTIATSTTTLNHPNNTSGHKKNNKRKRLQQQVSHKSSSSEYSESEQQQQIFQLLNDYYQRLVYQCHKDLNKHIKRTKTFILQKQIRVIKESAAAATAAAAKKKSIEMEDTSKTDNIETQDGTTTTPSHHVNHRNLIQKQEMKLQQMKDCFNHPNKQNTITDMVLQECDRRLGMVQLDPKLIVLLPEPSRTKTKRTNHSTKLNMDDDDDDVDVVVVDEKGDDQDDSGSIEICSVDQNKVGSGETADDEKTYPGRTSTIDIADETSAAATLSSSSSPPSLLTSSASSSSALSMEISSTMLQRILQHKAIVTALEHWHNEVTQYRIWSMQQQERLYSDSKFAHSNAINTTKGGRPTKKTKKRANETDPLSSANNSSMFVSLGHNSDDDDTNQHNNGADDDDPYSYYGPGTGSGEPKKKNRQGQRGRRAKMAAIEAKKFGRSIPKEESMNWRRGGGGGGNTNNNNKSTNSNDASYNNKNYTRKDANTSQKNDTTTKATSTKNTTDTTAASTSAVTLHPSWQAKKESKATIVAFQGTKITFD